MLPQIDLPRALLRGRYMVAAAQMERNGVPIDVDTLELLRQHWSNIQDQLIAEVDRDYGVFEGRTFKADRFAELLTRNNIPWPRLDSGRLDLGDDTFREMARAYPIVAPLHELRSALSQDAAFRSSGRARMAATAPCCRHSGRARAATSRATPSSILVASVWLRGLIEPPPGCGIAYIDWAQQEFGIAAALSGDPLMMAAYRSAIRTWRSPSRPGRHLQMRRKPRTRPSATNSSQRCWRFNTGWAPTRWHSAFRRALY